ncbi:MAG: hypothetical protein HC923_02580 [Myxococcales bacterium]|nr:hypothetical protein [Myxococcales bacterium]
MAPDDGDGARAAERLPGVQAAELRNGSILLTLNNDSTDFSFIAQAMLAGRLRIHEIKQEEVNLETAFLRFTTGACSESQLSSNQRAASESVVSPASSR